MKPIAKALETYLNRQQMKGEMEVARVWQNWETIMGQDMAELAKPLGRRKQSLIIGVYDSVAMQELVFFADDILDRIQKFLGRQPFDKVAVELIKGRTSLDAVHVWHSWQAPTPKLPQDLGKVGDQWPQDSVVRTCYQAYLRAVAAIQNSK